MATNAERFETLLDMNQLRKVPVGDVCFVHFPIRAAIGTRVFRPAIVVYILSSQGAVVAHVRLPRQEISPVVSGLSTMMTRMQAFYCLNRAFFSVPDTRIICVIYGNRDSRVGYINYIWQTLGGYGIGLEIRYRSLRDDDNEDLDASPPETSFAERGRLYM